jgi:hypothetical protein
MLSFSVFSASSVFNQLSLRQVLAVRAGVSIELRCLPKD